MGKVKVATCSLAGCFGCHMSLLDIDEKLLDLLELVEFDRSPINDIKTISAPVDVGLIEGGVCNVENVHTLREFRRMCKVLVAVGECANTGGVPSMRNGIPLKRCLEESFVRGQGTENAHIPDDPELPLLLNRVRPLHHIVKIDHFLPGCPPSADAFWHFLTELLAGRNPALPSALIRFD
ncbi:MAG: NADP oxidoreductase [Vicinamibacteria bacterium]|jgi:NAD-reducing hydrogenase small subunit|nr:NADP oxidoreductase [Vicinamibacteria bacterium]MBP9945007.1 NADP oxidoreductase [Vicinamibacteria bacterium]